MHVIPTEFFPPMLSIVGGGSGVVTEGDSIVLSCNHTNFLDDTQEAWLDPQGNLIVFEAILQLSNIQRNQSGSYTCFLFISTVTGSIERFSSINVTVTCKC